jgi:hypothetical protein
MARLTDEELLARAAEILVRRRAESSSEFISAVIRAAAHKSRERQQRDSQLLIFGNAGAIKRRAAQRARDLEREHNQGGLPDENRK